MKGIGWRKFTHSFWHERDSDLLNEGDEVYYMPEEPPYVLMKSEIKKVRLLPISRARRALGSCELTLANGDVIDYNNVFLSKERGLAKMIAKQKDDIAESRKEIQRLLKEIAGKEPMQKSYEEELKALNIRLKPFISLRRKYTLDFLCDWKSHPLKEGDEVYYETMPSSPINRKTLMKKTKESPYVLLKSKVKSLRFLPISRTRRALGSCELTLANGDVIDYNSVFLNKEKGLTKIIAKLRNNIAESRNEIHRLLKQIVVEEHLQQSYKEELEKWRNNHNN